MRLPPLYILLHACAFAAACGSSEAPPPAVGTLERNRVALIAESREPIVEILLAEGAVVAAGDVLLRLDTTRAEARLAQARAERDRAQRRLDELIRGPRRENILETEARLAGAESELSLRAHEVARVRALVDGKLVSAQDLDRANAARDRAAAERDATAAELSALLSGTTVEELDQARLSLTQAEARMVELGVDLERLTVRAPVPGTLDALPFELGEQPPQGATVAVMLAAGPPFARVYLPAALRSRVSAGAQAEVRVHGRDRVFAARLRFVAAEAAFTPYFALTEHDRGRLSYLAEIDLTEAAALELPTGVPVVVSFPDTAVD
jgi:HlyD family secretion protein